MLCVLLTEVLVNIGANEKLQTFEKFFEMCSAYFKDPYIVLRRGSTNFKYWKRFENFGDVQ